MKSITNGGPQSCPKILTNHATLHQNWNLTLTNQLPLQGINVNKGNMIHWESWEGFMLNPATYFPRFSAKWVSCCLSRRPRFLNGYNVQDKINWKLFDTNAQSIQWWISNKFWNIMFCKHINLLIRSWLECIIIY